MDNIVQKIYDFIIWFIGVIQDLVKSVSGKKDFIPPTAPATEAEETTAG